MSHFLFVRSDEDVLGVWEASDEVSLLRLRLSLQLTYPSCRTHVLMAPNFETVKQNAPFDLEGIELHVMSRGR